MIVPDTTIVGAACCFPSGPTIDLADVALRNRLCLTRAHPSYHDVTGAAVRLSYFPAESPAIERFDAARWGLLARHALAQLTQTLWASRETFWRSPRWLWVVLPDKRRPGIPIGLSESVRASLGHELWEWERVSFVHGGHAAGLLALQQARKALMEFQPAGATSDPPLAVVIAVESAIGVDALAWLDAQQLLHGAGITGAMDYRPQPHGRVPGEGSAAIALMVQSPEDGTALAPWARLAGCATAFEPTSEAEETGPCTGMGLSEAATEAVAEGDVPPIAVVYTDLNGETVRSNEFGFATVRLGSRLVDGWARRQPALASGDLHCASSLTHVALSAYGIAHKSGDVPHLILASSDDSLRGAIVLTRSELPSWKR